MAVTKAAFQSSRVPFREADGQALVLHVEQVSKGARKSGGWLSTCSARGADLHRLFGDMSKQSGLLINKTKKGHR